MKETYQRYNSFTNSIEIIEKTGKGLEAAVIQGCIPVNDKVREKVTRKYFKKMGYK